jgi:hypothetical protein
MGGGGKGGTTTTQTMQIPPEVLARYNAVNARAETVAQTPYQAYSSNPNAFVAPLTQTQQAGIQNTNAMAGAAQPYYGAAAGLTAMGAGSANPEGLNIGQYYNPYTQAVAAPTLQALQQQQGVERSNLMNPQAARSFGGDRSGLVAANLARQQELGTAQAMAPIYKQAYDQATQTAQQQQGVGLAAQQANLQRLGQAGAQFGQLGSGAQAAGLAGAQAQLGAGATEQQTGQAGLQALYNQFQQQQAYPFQIAQFLSNIATGTGALSGNTTTSNTQGGGGFFSDERLKENIEQVGKTNDGQNIYRYNYKGDPRSQIGLIAQEVAKDHPDAVGKRNGYLTVDYRDATNDSVRGHKADGGDVGTSAYDIDAPSAMMGASPVTPEMLARFAAKPMAGLGGMPISTGATAPGAAGILAPKATGLSPGSIEGARAQLSTIQGADMSKSQSGADYFDQQRRQLQDFLATHGASSQGGLVSAPGEYAEGGYVNPALQYYAPQAGKAGLGMGGPYGAQLTPAQVQMMRAAELAKPAQQKSGIEQANQIASLTSKGYDAWKSRPKWMGNDTDAGAGKGDPNVKPGGATNVNPGLGGGDASITSGAKNPSGEPVYTGPKVDGAKSTMRVSDLGGNDQVAGLAPEQMPDFEYSDAMFAARGGLIHREHHAGGLGVGTPYGSISEESALGDALTSPTPHYQMMEAGKMGKPAPQPSGAEQVTKMAGQAKGLFDKGKNVYDFAAKKLSGDAVGAAGQPVNVGSATGYTTPGLASGEAAATPLAEATTGAASAATPAIESGIAAAAPATEGLAAAAPIAEGLAGAAGAADAGAGLAGLAGAAEGPGLIGALASGAGAVGEGLSSALPFLLAFLHTGGRVDGHRQHHADGERVEDTGEAPQGDDFLSKLASTFKGAGDTTVGLGKKVAENVPTSENFWVPAIAGLGSMLASPNKTLAGAIGSGLVGGATTYENMQKQNALEMKQRLEMAKGMFTGPEIINGQKMYNNTYTGQWVPEAEMLKQRGMFTGSGQLGAGTPTVAPPAPAGGVTDAAKSVVTQPAPTIQPRPVQAAEPAAKKPAPEAAPPVGGDKAVTGVDKVSLEAAVRRDPTVFEALPENRRPAYLEKQADTLEADAERYQEQSQEATRRAGIIRENPAGVKRENEEAARLDALAKSKRDEAAKKREAAQTLYNNAIDLKYEDAKKRMQAGIESENALVDVVDPNTGATMLKPKSEILGKTPAPGAGSPPGQAVGSATTGAMKSEPENIKNARNEIGKEEIKMAEDFRRRETASSRVNGLLDILTKYETGKFAEQKADIIGKLNGLGIRVDPTVSADPAKFEIFMKSAIKNVFDDLPGGKILLAEIAGLSKANATPGMQAEANAKILGDAKAAINYENKYTLDYAKWRKENPSLYSPFDTIKFNEQWLKQNKLDDFKKEVARTIGYVGQKLPSNLSEAKNGQAYYLPDKKDVYYFDANRKDASGKPTPGFSKTDPLAGNAGQ